jgi:hypothetical protein
MNAVSAIKKIKEAVEEAKKKDKGFKFIEKGSFKVTGYE